MQQSLDCCHDCNLLTEVKYPPFQEGLYLSFSFLIELELLLVTAETTISTMSYDKYPMEIGLVYGSAVTSVVEEVKVEFKVLRAVV